MLRNWLLTFAVLGFPIVALAGSAVIWFTFGLGVLESKPGAVPWMAFFITFVGVWAALIGLTLTLLQIVRKPEIKVMAELSVDHVYHTSVDESHNVPIYLSIMNEGNSVAIWYLIQLNTSDVPPVIRQRQGASAGGDFVGYWKYDSPVDPYFVSNGELALFPFQPGYKFIAFEFRYVRNYAIDIGYPSILNIPYTVYGDWGAPQYGIIQLAFPEKYRKLTR